MKTSESTPRTPRKTTTAALKTTALPAKRVRATRSAPTRRKVATPDAPMAIAPTIDDLNRRAYEIYLARNGQGDALSDWLQAEQELMATSA